MIKTPIATACAPTCKYACPRSLFPKTNLASCGASRVQRRISSRAYEKEKTKRLVDHLLRPTRKAQRRVGAALGHARAAAGRASPGAKTAGNAGRGAPE